MTELMIVQDDSTVGQLGQMMVPASTDGNSRVKQQTQFSLDNFIGSDHNITLTQKDGKTVAILTLPNAAAPASKPEQPKSIFGKSLQASTSSMADLNHRE